MIHHHPEASPILPFVVRFTRNRDDEEARPMIEWCLEHVGAQAKHKEVYSGRDESCVDLGGQWSAHISSQYRMWRFRTYEGAFDFMMRWQ